MIKHLIVLILLTIASSTFASNKKLITINKFISHPALDAAEKGIEEGLKERGLLPGIVSIQFANAQGSIGTAAQIAKHHASLRPDFMVAIATPSAQANFKARTGKAIVAFVAVTDPEAAGLHNLTHLIGVSDFPPIEELLVETLKLLPNLKTIGVIYNTGEINSVKMVEKLEELALKHKIIIKKTSVNSISNIKIALLALLPKVDVLYLPQDNLVVSAIGAVSQQAANAKIPIITNDPSLRDKGIFLAIGYDYFQSGRQLANMIADIIEGKKLKENIQRSTVN